MNFNYACYMRSGNCTSLLSNFSWFVFTISVSTLDNDMVSTKFVRRDISFEKELLMLLAFKTSSRSLWKTASKGLEFFYVTTR